MKSYLKTYDINKSNYIKHIIIIRSESIWTTADNMISLSQIATENQISRINDAYYVILLNLISGLLLLVMIRKYVKENLEYNIERDPLTNLYNRRYFSHVLRFEIDRCNRYGNKLSVIMFDIDNFKGINDKFGHDIGDNVLIELGNLIKKNIRSTDTLSRLGGEEFVIIATETEIEDAVKVANKVRTIISEHQFKIVGNVTVSIGITEFKNKDTFNSIYKRADNALYRAKNKGKNTCEIIKVNE